MDRTDAKILGALQRDGRLTWAKLAGAVNLSASACQRRVDAMLANGVIENFTININDAALGYTVRAFVAVNIDRQNTALAREFRNWVQNHPQVQTCHMISGTIDFLLEVVAIDLRSFGRFIDEELLNLAAVKDASSSIVLNVDKKKHQALDLHRRTL